MNLFGLEIRLRNGNRNGYVKQRDCHVAQDSIKDFVQERVDDLKETINTRVDDVKDFILKNGR